MQIYVARDGQHLGQFSVEEINRKLADGTLSLTDLGWHEGAAGWAPLSSIAGVALPAAPAMPMPPPPAPSSVPITPPPAPSPMPSPPPARPAQSTAGAAMVQQPVQNYKGMAVTSWILLGLTFVISLVPVLGCGSWLLAWPVAVATLIMAIIILTRGGKTQGIAILIASILLVPMTMVVSIASTALLGASVSEREKAQEKSLDAQAIAQAKEHFESVWVKHGDLWYAVNGGKLLAAKGITFEVLDHPPLTEADKLNQLEWSGVVDCRASASCARLLNSGGGWNQWETGLQLYAGDGVGLEHHEGTTSYQLEKRGGQWRIINPAFESARRPSPEQLPKEKPL
jgi:GYF domain 2